MQKIINIKVKGMIIALIIIYIYNIKTLWVLFKQFSLFIFYKKKGKI